MGFFLEFMLVICVFVNLLNLNFLVSTFWYELLHSCSNTKYTHIVQHSGMAGKDVLLLKRRKLFGWTWWSSEGVSVFGSLLVNMKGSIHQEMFTIDVKADITRNCANFPGKCFIVELQCRSLNNFNEKLSRYIEAPLFCYFIPYFSITGR